MSAYVVSPYLVCRAHLVLTTALQVALQLHDEVVAVPQLGLQVLDVALHDGVRGGDVLGPGAHDLVPGHQAESLQPAKLMGQNDSRFFES